jgi:hypothetical protein
LLPVYDSFHAAIEGNGVPWPGDSPVVAGENHGLLACRKVTVPGASCGGREKPTPIWGLKDSVANLERRILQWKTQGSRPRPSCACV